MSFDSNAGSATATQDASSQSVGGQTAGSDSQAAGSQSVPTSQTVDSGAGGGLRTPASAPGGPVFGDADLPNDIPPPRPRDEQGRFASQDRSQGNKPVVDDGSQQDWMTPLLKQEAAFYGFTETEAKAFGSPELLQAAMAALDRRMVRDLGQGQFDGRQQFAGREFPAGQGAGQQRQDWNTPPAQPGFAQQQDRQQQAVPQKFDLSKYKDLFDEDTTKVLGELHSSFQSDFARQQAVIEQLQSQLASMRDEVSASQGQRFEAETDAFFDSISKDYGDLFGKGPIRELTPDLQRARQELVAYKTMLDQADWQMGRAPASHTVGMNRAIRALYGERQAQQIRNQVSQQVQARRSQGTARPTARTAERLDPLAAAANRADEIYKSRGFDVPTSNGMGIGEI